MLSCISTTWDQVQHLDVPTSERMSRCDRILGAACLKRRALKKLEPGLQQPAPSGKFPLPPAWEVTVPSLLMVQLRMPQNMADRLASTAGSDTAAGQIRQLQRLQGPTSERRDLVFTLLASR
ncbi:hypothetical protein FOQG_10727 [Fusarium oxysporum f. sp. raphani 54005]|uniref:Uncharacterized protein n=1 Tax=Fusarium oxysporum f. sp. raphani 54005 TaxID=1089458 RepID=X0C3J4_FUSOX|nr:hypothetical protein FOQG_10727 [Fusarium oxysporum f. sp. raphani 54005]